MSGPPVGGILYYYFKWKNTFFILLVAHIVVLVIAAFLFYIGEVTQPIIINRNTADTANESHFKIFPNTNSY